MQIKRHWYWTILSILLLMYVSVTISYKLSKDSFQIKKVPLKLNREYDNELFKINENAAFILTRSQTISIVKYKKTIFPFCFLCGEFEQDGTIVNVVEFQKDNWFYTQYPGPFAEGYNLQTQETFDVPEQEDFSVDLLMQIPDYQNRNFQFSPSEKITPEWITERFQKISNFNESCLIFNSAFLILIIVWLIVGVFVILKNH